MPNRNEHLFGHAIRCYDNGGKTMDRYTVVYMDEPDGHAGLYNCIGMNSEPFHGIGMHSSAMAGAHLGKRIAFSALPEKCREAVKGDLQHGAEWWADSEGNIELLIRAYDAGIGYHQGDCDSDVRDLMAVPYIKRQLAALDRATVRKSLEGWGAWDDKELANHQDNLMRLLWLACGDLVERENMKEEA